MQTEQIVALLVAERDRLSRAIEVLQGSSAPAVKAAAAAAVAEVPAKAAAPGRKKRKPRTAAQRKQQAERMRAFWAARRKQKAK